MMAPSTGGIPDRPSGRLVLMLGFLMTGSLWIQVADFLPLSLDLTWFLPLLAAWLAHRHGIAVLRCWWPLLVLPALGASLDHGIGIRFGAPLPTLVLALVIAAAVDTRLVLPPPKLWLRGDTGVPAIAGFCLLVIAALDDGTWRVGDVRINPLACIPALIFLIAIRWEALAGVVWPAPSRRAAGVLAIAVAALVLSGLALKGSLAMGPVSLRFGSYSLATLVPVLCFGLVVLGHVRPRATAWLLIASLAIDRLLAMVVGESLAVFTSAEDWQRLSWETLFGSLAAALAGQVFRPFLQGGTLELPDGHGVVHLILAWIAMLLLTALLTGYRVPSSGSALWLLAALSFAAGTRWRERSLIFVPPLLMFLWLLAATTTPAGTAGNAADALATMGLVSFPFAFCGAFLAISRQFSLTSHAARAPAAADTVYVVDVSRLAETVERIDRSTTWRSFLVVAAPFVVLWQVVELYGLRHLVEQTTEILDGEPLLEDWHYAAAVLLAFAPLAFVFWDWLDRQDRLRLLALVSGSGVGALAWQVFGGLLGFSASGVLEEFSEETLVIGALLALPVLLSGAGLLAGTDRRFARPIFLSLCGLAIASCLFGLAWLSIDDGLEPQALLAAILQIGGVALLAYALAGFIRLRLLLAGDRPRELLFGALREKGFWVRMAAASGLPSSSWRRGAVVNPAFWALFAARFVVYIGAVLTRSRALVGAVVIVFGHLLFHAGKRLSAREIWRPQAASAPDRPILFLRGFDDDQCTFRRPSWHLLARWLDLWSFRQNLDEALVDELAQFGPVIALGRPGDARTPFGAQRHYADHADWQATLAAAARSAQAIVLVASDSPGVKWEYDLLKNEAMLEKVLLLFRPDIAYTAASRHAAEWFCSGAGATMDGVLDAGLHPVSLRFARGTPTLTAAQAPNAAAGVLSLRLHFHDAGAQ